MVSGGWPEGAVLGDDPVQPLVVRRRPDTRDAVDLEADADRQRARRQRRQRAVEKAAAVAETVAGCVETVERQQDQVGCQPGAGSRCRNVITIGGQRRFRRPFTEGQWLARGDDHRQRRACAGPRPVRQQGTHVRLVLDRPAEGGDRRPRQGGLCVRNDARRQRTVFGIGQGGTAVRHVPPQPASPRRVILGKPFHPKNLA